VGVSEAESRGILDLLYPHLTKPGHTIRHRWQVGDLGIWDNRSTAHYANRDDNWLTVGRAPPASRG
jgi:taurine dioxygenase